MPSSPASRCNIGRSIPSPATSRRAGGEESSAANIRRRRPTFFSGRNGATVPTTSSPGRRVKTGPHSPQGESAGEYGANCSAFLLLRCRQHHVDVTGETVGGRVIIVERDNCVVEMLAEMVDYAHHAKRHAADPETRENVENE